MVTLVTVLAEKTECLFEKVQALGFEVKDDRRHYLLETHCIVDTGVDITCTMKY